MSSKQKGGREFTIAIPGKPQPKQRARVLRNGRSYTPPETADYERKVIICFLKNYHKADALGCAVEMKIMLCFAIPKSWPKVKQAQMYGRLHTQKPDATNCVKSIEDALNGYAYIDDSQIASLTVCKRWSDSASATVIITEFREEEK